MNQFYLNPRQIKVAEDLPRFRKELGDVKGLVESIQKYGQLQPIIIDRDNTLIIGGRRLAACLMGDIEALCVYKDNVDPLTMREMELEENIQRKAFTPAEEIMAVRELHELKQKKYGEATSGREGGWKQSDTADVIGMSRASVIESLVLAEVLNSFPELKACKTKSDIRRAAKGMIRVAEEVGRIDEFESFIKENPNTNFPQTFLTDALDHMSLMPHSSIDILLTDPPYGQEIQDGATGLGGITGGLSASGFKFDDSAHNALNLYASLAVESYRFCTPEAHAYIFVCPEHFFAVRELFVGAGWNCHIKPIIWIKRGVGQCNQPSRWPASAYEMILYCRKDNAKLVKEGRLDWIDSPVVNWTLKRHPTEKPVDLIRELIQRSVLPGARLYDPFAGSGSVLEAAFREKLFSVGCELLEEAYASMCSRLYKLGEE